VLAVAHRPDAGRHSPLEHDSRDDIALESAAADNELVSFVNKVIIDAYNQKVSDIHIDDARRHRHHRFY
jgi:type II secretory ATPase GspE/PulE/Tfp pilus assembly ATPase PilB-like protein